MQRRTILTIVLISALSLGAVALALGGRDRAAPLAGRSEAGRPTLLLLSSLPIIFAEKFTIDGGSPALTRLGTRYRVAPIAVADKASLKGERLLIAAQPRAQPAEALVDLDAWVRDGGRLLLLADPALVWPTKRALGDPLRAPNAFADTGLLTHWGLRLDAPDELGPKVLPVGGIEVLAGSPGVLVGLRPGCAIESFGLVARCRIGRGRVTIIADADFLDVGRPEGLDGPVDHNLDALLAELAALEPQ